MVVSGNQDYQAAFIQANLGEVNESLQEEGTQSTLTAPFRWIRDNPGKSASAVAATLGYLWYEDSQGGGGSQPVSRQGVTQEGSNNSAIFKDVDFCPEVHQRGEGQTFECDTRPPPEPVFGPTLP